MKTTRLKPFYNEIIMRDQVLCGKISQALNKSMVSVRYRMVPGNDERLTYPRIQNIIREHLNLKPGLKLIEEVETTTALATESGIPALLTVNLPVRQAGRKPRT